MGRLSSLRLLANEPNLRTNLVKQIKQPSAISIGERSLFRVKGKPVSETILEERR
ncbi:hypothetical protein [Roseofilum sp. Guam]|uniref:hypothetical protein n=1 Tax=Roseofilum sp. Guam TaxID=2821502 RepID=UPI001B20BF47|nr:hypothetical protein [Roseofilum sp. Guam]MBP0028840.1 hypothetical protein [Roseofilum sp. Guam]